jgi:hypothetical protein
LVGLVGLVGLVRLVRLAGLVRLVCSVGFQKLIIKKNHEPFEMVGGGGTHESEGDASLPFEGPPPADIARMT